MMGSKRLRRLGGVAAALVGVLFFFIIVGVFGLRFAIAGLVGALSAATFVVLALLTRLLLRGT